jgi:WD40 repeat protein
VDDGYLVVWDIESGREVQNLYLSFHGPLCALVWTPLNPDLATGAFLLASVDGSVQLYRRSCRDDEVS